MTALITGASSGIGRAIAVYLAEKGYDLIIAARRKQRLMELKLELTEKYGVRVRIFRCDLSKAEECLRLYKETKRVRVDILVNSAGFGVFGEFDETSLTQELKMLDVNIRAVHILTKLFLKDFKARDRGYILNVASVAGFMAGPTFSSYYASKSYVLQLTKAIYEELRHAKSHVHISAFCPGPVRTEFNEISGAEFAVSGITDEFAAKYAIDHMFAGELLIIPTLLIKATAAAARFVPTKLMLAVTGSVQRSREAKE